MLFYDGPKEARSSVSHDEKVKTIDSHSVTSSRRFLEGLLLDLESCSWDNCVLQVTSSSSVNTKSPVLPKVLSDASSSKIPSARRAVSSRLLQSSSPESTHERE
jgi:hypothetical protein